MSYPPYQGGAPPPGGYPGAGGFSQPGYPSGGVAMPTPESASSAAYGGGLPYAAQPGGGLGFDGMGYNSSGGYPQQPPPGPGGFPGGPGYLQGGGYPPAGGGPPGGYPMGQNVQPGYPSGAGAPSYPQPGYNQAGGAPGYPQQPQGYSQPQGGAPGYNQPPGGAPGYNQPPGGAPGYNQPQGGAPGYNQPQGGAPGYNQQPGGGSQPYGGYGQGAPTSAPSQPPGYSSVPAQSNVPSAATYNTRDEGTLRPHPNFNVESDVQVLRKAMKGLGTDEKAIIDILGYRSCDQRQNIKLMYKTCFGRDLMSDLKSELSSRFENVIIALLFRKDEYDAYELRRAMRGAGTDEAALIEILCTRNNAEIHALSATYKTMHGRKLEEDIISETSGHFKKLLVSMSVGGRMENQAVDQNKANTDAQKLYQAGAKRWGTDENTFNMILASQSFAQLRAVFDAYSRIANNDFERAISSEMSGDLARGMRTIVSVVRNKAGYFADQLYHTMKGAGTDDRTLIRIVVTRCEVDMKQIKEEFMRRYGKTLESFIRDDVSGDYRKILMALVGGQP